MAVKIDVVAKKIMALEMGFNENREWRSRRTTIEVGAKSFF